MNPALLQAIVQLLPLILKLGLDVTTAIKADPALASSSEGKTILDAWDAAIEGDADRLDKLVLPKRQA